MDGYPDCGEVGRRGVDLGVECDGGVDGQKVCKQTGDVGRSHGGSGICVRGGVTFVPGGEDLRAM